MNNSRWNNFGKYHRIMDIPIFSFSTSFSFDSILNQVFSGSKTFTLNIALLQDNIYFYDSDSKLDFSAFVGVRLIFSPIVNKAFDPPQIGGTISFLVYHKAGNEMARETTVFDLKPFNLCSSDSDFPSDIADPFISEKLRNLNYFQVLNKMSIFYSVKKRLLVIKADD